jgi:hypothetical protein
VSGSLAHSRPVVKSGTAVMGSYDDVYFCVVVGAFDSKVSVSAFDQILGGIATLSRFLLRFRGINRAGKRPAIKALWGCD